MSRPILHALVVVSLSACASSPPPTAPAPEPYSEALLVLEVHRLAPGDAAAQLARWVDWRCDVELQSGESITARLTAVDRETLTLSYAGQPQVIPLADITRVTRESEALHESK